MQKFKFFTLAILAMLSVNFAWGADKTVSVNISTLVSEKGYTVSSGSTINTKCLSIDLDDNINLSLNGSGNNGSFWGTAPSIDWRAYQTESATYTLTAKNGATLKSVTFTFAVSNNGTLNTTGTGSSISTGKLTSGTALSLTGTSKTFYVGNTDTKTNGQVRITAISVTYTAAAATPTITKTANLTDFTYEEGSGPSAAQSFTVGGSNLTANITVTAPTNFEVSKSSGSAYANSVTLTQSSGTVSNTTIYVRMKSGLSQGTGKGGDITLSSTGATTQTIAVVGTVTAPTVYYTVTLLNNGQPVNKGGFDTNGQKQYVSGATLGELPTLTSAEACDEHSNHFMGWYAGEQPIRTKQPTAPTMVTSSTPATDGMILRAVWARAQ